MPPRKTSKARSSKAQSQSSKPRSPADPAARALDAALALAAERGWRKVALKDVAQKSRLSLAELYTLYPGRAAILRALWRRMDAAVLAGGPADGDTARDRLFEIMMRRFDALAGHKAGIEAILRDAGADPLMFLCGAVPVLRSMSWMLEAAGIGSHGLIGRARAKALALVYLATLRVWLSDDSPDLAATMAALDKRLRRAEGLANFCARFDPRERRSGSAAGATAP
jgi:AcrR family transcriptional regulator